MRATTTIGIGRVVRAVVSCASVWAIVTLGSACNEVTGVNDLTFEGAGGAAGAPACTLANFDDPSPGCEECTQQQCCTEANACTSEPSCKACLDGPCMGQVPAFQALTTCWAGRCGSCRAGVACKAAFNCGMCCNDRFQGVVEAYEADLKACAGPGSKCAMECVGLAQGNPSIACGKCLRAKCDFATTKQNPEGGALLACKEACAMP